MPARLLELATVEKDALGDPGLGHRAMTWSSAPRWARGVLVPIAVAAALRSLSASGGSPFRFACGAIDAGVLRFILAQLATGRWT